MLTQDATDEEELIWRIIISTIE